MALERAFSVSATNPRSWGYDPATPTQTYVDAALTAYGVFTGEDYGPTPAGVFWPFELSSQVELDELCLGYSPADPNDESDISQLSRDVYRHSALHLWLVVRTPGITIGTDGELIGELFGFRNPSVGIFGNETTWGSVQFFVGSEFVHSEAIDDQTESVAVLADVSDPSLVVDNTAVSVVHLYMRLASTYYAQTLMFTGAEGYLI